MKKLVIYHNEDNDGLFSAAIANKFERSDSDTIDFLGLRYADLKNVISNSPEAEKSWDDIVKYDKVIMADFSFPVEYLERLHNILGDNFIWCDHHYPIMKSAAEAGLGNIPGIRDTGFSALANTWKYYTSESLPEYLNLLQLYDSWTYTAENEDEVKAVNEGITAMYELDLERIKKCVLDPRPGIADAAFRTGSVLLKEKKRKNRQIIKKSGDRSFTVGPENRKACAIVYSDAANSDVFESLKNGDILHGIVFRRNACGTWVMSLYNVNDNETFHCGEYLKENYGGGGHAGAAGCEISEETAFNIIKAKHI